MKFLRTLLYMDAHVCPLWFASFLANRIRRFVHDPLKILGPFIRPGDTCIDIGCGPGFFTLPMAAMAGDTGKIIAVDIQERMLERLMRRAAAVGLDGRIVPRLATGTDLGLRGDADFALAFWMAHEVRDRDGFFRQVRDALKPGGRLLLSEPKVHVARVRYEESAAAAIGAGFMPEREVEVSMSRSRLFVRP